MDGGYLVLKDGITHVGFGLFMGFVDIVEMYNNASLIL